MYLIVGLGNPGLKYENTRHNVGFMFIDALSEKLGVKVDRAKFNALVAEANIAGEKCLIMKPQTFMNNSGEAVIQAVNFYKIPAQNVVVIFDDISLEPGNLRIKRKGSAGGHNGIKSIISHLKSEDFQRIKIGIGAKPSADYDLADYVLSKLDKNSREKIDKSIENATKALSLMVDGDVERAMNLYNS